MKIAMGKEANSPLEKGELIHTNPGTIVDVPPGDYSFGDDSGDDSDGQKEQREKKGCFRPRKRGTSVCSDDETVPTGKRAPILLTGTSGTSETEEEHLDASPPSSPDEDRPVVIIEDVPDSSVPSSTNPMLLFGESARHSLAVSTSGSEADRSGAHATDDESDLFSFDKVSKSSSGDSDALISEPEHLRESSNEVAEIKAGSSTTHEEVCEDSSGGSQDSNDSSRDSTDGSVPIPVITGKESGDSLPSDPVSIICGLEEEKPSVSSAELDSSESENEFHDAQGKETELTDPPMMKRVSSNDSLAKFLSELEGDEKEPDSSTIKSSKSGEEPDTRDLSTSPRCISKLAPPPSDTKARRGASTEIDPTLKASLTPLSARRAQLQAMQSTSPQRLTDRQKDIDQTFSMPVSERKESFLLKTSSPSGGPSKSRIVMEMMPTSIRERRAALLSAASAEKGQKAFDDDALRAAAVSQPVHRRQLSFQGNSVTGPAASVNDDLATLVSMAPIAERLATLEQGYPRERKSRVELDAALFASSTPLNARRAALAEKNSPRAVSSERDTDLAVGTSLEARRGALAESMTPRKLSFEKDIHLASSTPLDARRAALADSSSPRETSFERDTHLASSTPLDARRAALAESSSPRETSFERDTHLASSTPLDARRAALAESSSPRETSFERDTHLASSTPLDARRAALAESNSSRVFSFERGTSIASAMSLEERRAALSTMSRSNRYALSYVKDGAFLAASSMGVKERQVAYAQFLQDSALRNSQSIQAELDALKEQSLVSSRRRTLRNRRARADRLFYQIGQKRGGLSDKDFLRVADFLPRERVILELKASSDSYEGPTLSFETAQSSIAVPLCIWLLSPQEKTFEIVSFEMKGDMTVEEVIEEACNHALDPVLSEQHYVSLCNTSEELVEPTKTIDRLFEESPSTQHQTLMAVPFGATAALVRAIRRVLEKTDQMQRWLNRPDPFIVKKEEPEIEADGNADVGSKRKGDRKVMI